MKNFGNPREPWADELWNVSLLPLTLTPDVRSENQRTLGQLENIDERGSLTNISRSFERQSRPLEW